MAVSVGHATAGDQHTVSEQYEDKADIEAVADLGCELEDIFAVAGPGADNVAAGNAEEGIVEGRENASRVEDVVPDTVDTEGMAAVGDAEDAVEV